MAALRQIPERRAVGLVAHLNVDLNCVLDDLRGPI
jgi:hypothetical protein